MAKIISGTEVAKWVQIYMNKNIQIFRKIFIYCKNRAISSSSKWLKSDYQCFVIPLQTTFE